MAEEFAGPIRSILFPTDFSPASEYAFEYAERLALSTGASLLVLHVFGVPDTWGTGGMPERVDEEIKKRLTGIKPSSAAVKVEYISHGGPAGDVICWLAQERGCDLIVIGTHGHTGFSHLILGSVAEYVVRHAACPVLTVRQRADHEKPIKEPEIYIPMPPIM